MSTNPWIWLAAMMTLAILSYLYKDNPAYRLAEHIFTGMTVGYLVVITVNQAAKPYILTPLLEHRWSIFIPIAAGLLYFSRFIPKYSHLMLIPIAISLGFGSGLVIPLAVEADLFKQLQGSMINTSMLRNVWDPYNGLIVGLMVLVGTICTISYFFFSREHKGALKYSANIGIWFVMVGFGASFGYTVMARISLLIGRIQFLFTDWIHLIK